MVGMIEVHGIKGVKRMFEGYSITVPKATERGLMNLAKFGAKTVKQSADKPGGLKPWGGGGLSIFRDTRAIKIKKGMTGVIMPIHGVWQDQMHDHWVSIRKGSLIEKWAKERGFKKKSIFVRRHPFLKHAVTKIEANAKKIVEKDINREIRRKGR